MKKYEIDMCNEALLGGILRYSIPLMATGALQLLYTTIDTMIVGKFVSKTALSAVGSTTTLINLLISVVVGISVGVNVVIAKYYGSKKFDKINDTIHTSIVVSVIFGLFITVIGMIFSKSFLILMGTPADVLDEAYLYVRIYFLGITFTLIYNFGSAIFRAIGDSRRPLNFLIVSSVAHIIISFILILGFKLGVAGVAIATICSQAISSLLIIFTLMRNENYRLSFHKLKINKEIMVKIIMIGLPAGLQSSVFSISNIIIQTSINSFGSTIIAGNSAAQSIENFIYIIMNSQYIASVTFTSQNVGAKKFERINPILFNCLVIVSIIGLSLSTLANILNIQVLSLFSSEMDVIKVGIIRLKIYARYYFIFGCDEVFVGSIRGMGNSLAPAIISLLGICVFRTVWIYTVFVHQRVLQLLYVSYPISWILTIFAHLICYLIVKKNVDKRLD